MSDVSQFLSLLDGLKQRELLPAKIKLGEIEVSFGGVLGVNEDDGESPEELERRLREEIDQTAQTMYGASMGGHVPGAPIPD